MSIRPLPPALAEKARVELNEDPKRLKDDLQSIKDWIAKQPHLNARTEDQWLVAFLRGCKYSLDNKRKIGEQEKNVSTMPEMDRIKHTDPLFDEILSLGVSVMLPKTLEPNAARINLMRPSKYGPSKYDLFDFTSVNNVIMKVNNQWLVAFLRGCKYSLERTKEKLDNYYSMRTTVPELERIKYSDPLFDEVLSLGVSVILPNISGPDGRRINLMRPGKYDPNKYNIMDIMSVNYTLIKILLVDDDHMTVSGIESIGDMEGLTLGHFLQMTPVVIKKLVAAGQDAAPLRIKGTHYLNTPAGFEKVYNLMKSFLNEKNRNRLYIYNNKNYDAMYKYIPKEILPAEYGGNGGSIEEIIDYWRSKVKEYSAWLEEDFKYKTDESKRPGKPKTAEDMFGVEGSFRQLEFD